MDDLSHLRAPASEFGLIFCSKLDTERANDSSEEELSTLDQSDHKKIRERKPFLAQITQKQDLSSRQTPFNSPNHLSANIGDQQQTNGEKQGIRASNSSSHPSDKDVSCLSTKKESSAHSLHLHNTRRNTRRSFVLVDEEEELVGDVVDETDQVGLSKEARIYYPSSHHWSLVIISIPNKEDGSGPIILHLDSLRLHSSKSTFSNVKSFLVEEWKFLQKEEVLPELPIAENIWNRLSRRIEEKVIEVPQQQNKYDCGLFVLFFMERFIVIHYQFGKQWFRPAKASSLRRRIHSLLTLRV
ncbi:uncharacterized protein LOC121800296 isoform X2 [Salvia splendens]|uniref:uncharacterized protein LOC121800296 isoform X2 n=1 Tax=Salvia splendens TaxID=180675 RepID=UPI001C254CC3|nr:uncharacterized protein LOC121800296 isoform X2 [Salvia splendens]